MLQNRQKTIILVCVAIVIVLVVMPVLLAQIPPPAPKPYASELCQMEYADRMVAGKAGWEVLSITMGPEGGKVGTMQFQPGDVIVKVGNRDIETGDRLDAMLRLAILEQQRTITLCDPQTGYEVIHSF
jgi:hypothetical protein